MTETITAAATPPGRGGVGVVRVSGPGVRHIIQSLFGSPLPPRQARLRHFRDADGDIIDQGLALFFPAPASYTGEDVLEFHGHGSPVVLDMMLAKLLTLGARLARPGEFTERAFLGGKLDLTQAEAVADLINSESKQSAKAAMQSLQGAFSRAAGELRAQLVQLRVLVEANIDFVDEDIEEVDYASLRQDLEKTAGILADLQQRAGDGVLLRDGLRCVLAGAPNVGKSSLLNLLTGEERAIVTEVPGTTRDLLTATMTLEGLPLHLFDTAGIRQNPGRIEAEGIRRAKDEVAGADRLLLVLDAARENPDLTRAAVEQRLQEMFGDLALPPVTLVFNKLDLLSAPPKDVPGFDQVCLSALTGEGCETLLAHLSGARQHQGEAGFIARRRHLDALQVCERHLRAGGQALLETGALELLADELRLAGEALGRLVGEYTSDDLLGDIFSAFCIGK